jgi:Protein of unknown function, DUF547
MTWTNATTLTALALGLAGLLLAGCGSWVRYDPDAPIGGTATLDDFPAVETLDHLALDAMLSRYAALDATSGTVLVDYDTLAAGGEATYLLDQYRAMLNAVDPAALATPAERQAYWINGYNASVLKGVTLNYGGDPDFSVLDSGAFFEDAVYSFVGVPLSLNQVEHGVLRGQLDHPAVASATDETLDAIAAFHDDVWEGGAVDARIHVALNCASLSCPNLRAALPFAYLPAHLDEQLDAAAAAFVDDPLKGAGPDGISRLFQWYGGDFDAGYGGADGFIEVYRDGGLAGVDLDTWLTYDWSLNIAP